MFVLEVECTDEDRDFLIADFWDWGSAGIHELPKGLRSFFDDEAMIPQLLSAFAAHKPEISPVGEEDWIGFARAQTAPMMSPHDVYPCLIEKARLGRRRMSRQQNVHVIYKVQTRSNTFPIFCLRG